MADGKHGYIITYGKMAEEHRQTGRVKILLFCEAHGKMKKKQGGRHGRKKEYESNLFCE